MKTSSKDNICSGRWALPGKTDKPLFGSLILSPDGDLDLELMGSFYDTSVAQRREEFPQEPVILGFTQDNECVTLAKCTIQSVQTDLGSGSRNCSYRTLGVFWGQHFENLEEIAFRRVSIAFSFLEYWIEVTGIREELHPCAEDTSALIGTIRYELPKLAEFQVEDFTVRFRVAESATKSLGDYKIKERFFIDVECEEAKSFYDYFTPIIYHIRDFLCLAMGQVVSIEDVYGVFPASKNDETPYPSGSVQIAFDLSQWAKGMKEKTPSYKALFSYAECEKNLPTILANWFTKKDMLKPVYQLFFGIMHSRQMYPYHQFLNLVTAMEVYNRRTTKKKLTLRKRVEIMLTEQRKYGFEADDEKLEIVSKAIVDTRNGLTHYGKQESKIEKGENLSLIILLCRVMVQNALLKEMGFSDSQIKTIWDRQHS